MYLKVEDSSVVILEGLSMWDNSVEQLVVQGEGGDGCQEPAVSCQSEEAFRSLHPIISLNCSSMAVLT